MTTKTLMNTAEMRAYLLKKRENEAARDRELACERAPALLEEMLLVIKGGASQSHWPCERVEAEAIVDLARCLGYEADVDQDDDGFCAVIKTPSLEI